MTYRWLRVPMLGAAALTMMLATTGAAQASPRGDGDYCRYDSGYRGYSGYNGYNGGYYRHTGARVVFRGGPVRVVYGQPRYYRYNRYDRCDRYDRYRGYHRYHDRW